VEISVAALPPVIHVTGNEIVVVGSKEWIAPALASAGLAIALARYALRTLRGGWRRSERQSGWTWVTSLEISNADGSGRRTRPSAGILVVCTIGSAGCRTRFAECANDGVLFPAMRVRQGADQHADEQWLMFSVRPVVHAELKAR
jgi:hypothetical protein